MDFCSGPSRFEGDRPRFCDRDGYRAGPSGPPGEFGGEKGGALPSVDIKIILSRLMERLSNYAASSSEVKNKKPAVTKNTVISAVTKIGLNKTRTGVGMTRSSTVPVKVKLAKATNVAPNVTAAKNLTV
ncbi:hypothetical protein AgCh_037889 [Apium graveolens]